MDIAERVIAEREALRAWLNSVPLQPVVEQSGIGRSWLSKFRRNKIEEPSMTRLLELQSCRRAIEGRKQKAA